MTTSSHNKIAKNADVNPDVVVQRSGEYGIVAEVKKSFPDDQDLWQDDFEQLQKYDDDLSGWYTPNGTIGRADLTLLTHHSRKIDVKDYIEVRQKEGSLVFDKPFSLVAFARVRERQEFLSLERVFGGLSDQALDERLRRVVQIPLEKLIPLYPMKFYDARPPDPLVMQILWEHIFSQLPREEEFSLPAGTKTLVVQVTVADIAQRMREQFGFPQIDDRQPEIPRTQWVREAMENFVLIGYAERPGPGSYRVRYTRKKDVLEDFVRKLAAVRKKKAGRRAGEEAQTEMFTDTKRV